MSTEEHTCPICHAPMAFSPRYPRAVCSQCAAQARNEQGELLAFYNETLSGSGFARLCVRRANRTLPIFATFAASAVTPTKRVLVGSSFKFCRRSNARACRPICTGFSALAAVRHGRRSVVRRSRVAPWLVVDPESDNQLWSVERAADLERTGSVATLGMVVP